MERMYIPPLTRDELKAELQRVTNQHNAAYKEALIADEAKTLMVSRLEVYLPTCEAARARYEVIRAEALHAAHYREAMVDYYQDLGWEKLDLQISIRGYADYCAEWDKFFNNP